MFSLTKYFRGSGNKNARIYLDHAAATPISGVAQQAIRTAWEQAYGNASAIHQEGQSSAHLLTTCREQIARAVEVQTSGVIFTSGGTEANNLAIRGVIDHCRHRGTPMSDMEILTTKIEHPATSKTIEWLKEQGVTIGYVPVDESGRVMLSELSAMISARTVLVAITYVNSEVGTIESVGSIGRAIKKVNPKTLLYVDAAQAPLWVPCVLPHLQADIMTFDAGKFGGPQGVGMLVMQKDITIKPIIFGGGQEEGRRPGTEPTALISGATAAFLEAQRRSEERSAKVSVLRDRGIEMLLKALPTAVLNGPMGEQRVANNINISIPGIDSEYAVVTLDVKGIAASTKSACSSAGGGESRVVKEITGDIARASSTLRFTLSEKNTLEEIRTLTNVLSRHIATTARG